MKNTARKMFVTMVMVSIGIATYGQFGVKAGIGNSSLLVKDNDVNASAEIFNSGFSFHIGGGYEIELGDMVSVEPALLFSQRASSFELRNQLFSLKFNYIEMPINVKVYALDIGDMRLYGFGGGYIAYMVSGKIDNEKLDIGKKNSDDFKSLDGGINIGVGIKMFDALNVDLSGTIGVANLSNDVSNGLRSKNRVVRLTVTYQFGG